jgi:hypothetical protein
MTEERHRRKRDELKELKSIRNLLMLQLLKMGASSEEIDLAVGIGSANVRRLFPNVKRYAGPKKQGYSKNAT